MGCVFHFPYESRGLGDCPRTMTQPILRRHGDPGGNLVRPQRQTRRQLMAPHDPVFPGKPSQLRVHLDTLAKSARVAVLQRSPPIDPESFSVSSLAGFVEAAQPPGLYATEEMGRWFSGFREDPRTGNMHLNKLPRFSMLDAEAW